MRVNTYEYGNNGHSTRWKRRKARKRHTLRRFIAAFVLLCCCGAGIIMAVNAVKTAGLDAGTPAEAQSGAGESRTAQSAADEPAWHLILINREHAIPDSYEVELTELGNRQSVDARIYPALQEMFDAARKNGVYPVVTSGYRTAEQQQRLMDEKIAEYRAEGRSAAEAAAEAEIWVAAPGTSEHQAGIAVDINADGIHSKGAEVYTWLDANAYRFGFIRRYPPDKTEITGIAGEPWHYRYVGIEAAAEIQERGMCLEEYLLL